MAAKLEWLSDSLRLVLWSGTIVPLANVYRPQPMDPTWDYAILGKSVSRPYEDGDDCRQDCEADVRRLLREAGVEVE